MIFKLFLFLPLLYLLYVVLVNISSKTDREGLSLLWRFNSFISIIIIAGFWDKGGETLYYLTEIEIWEYNESITITYTLINKGLIWGFLYFISGINFFVYLNNYSDMDKYFYPYDNPFIDEPREEVSPRLHRFIVTINLIALLVEIITIWCIKCG